MRVRDWWDNLATEDDHALALRQVGLSIDFAGVPWPFLPTRIRDLLTRLLRVTLPDDPSPPWKDRAGG
jgi:hypothetical protein